MTPTELQEYFYDACYYYMTDGDTAVIIDNFSEKCTLENDGNGIFIASWNYPEKQQPTNNDLEIPTLQQLQTYCIGRNKTIMIEQQVKPNIMYKLIKYLYDQLEIDIDQAMNTVY